MPTALHEPPEYCENCGAAIPPRAAACSECGADETTGWTDAEYEDPDEEFDYDEFVQREFPSDAPPGNLDVKRIAIASVIIIVLAAFLLLTIFGY